MLCVIAAAVVIGSLYLSYRGFQDEVFIEIAKGTGTRHMASELTNAGVIRYRWQFLVARAIRPSTRLQAGEYRFANTASVMTVFDRIARGDIYYHEITIPEGSNIFDIPAIVGESGIITPGACTKAARNTKIISDLDPQATSLEGYLFPSTYRITRSTTADKLVQMMVDQFRKEWKRLAAGRDLDVHRTVTLASLVEKETAVPAERPEVASVYRNRLRTGMKLDCDPTTIYAALLDNRYRGTIYKSDLESDNPYNTYRNSGLPPGPIANPGVASLKAAMSPAETDYLFFVAKPDGSGGHNFSATYAAHERAVEEYRSGQSKAGTPR